MDFRQTSLIRFKCWNKWPEVDVANRVSDVVCGYTHHLRPYKNTNDNWCLSHNDFWLRPLGDDEYELEARYKTAATQKWLNAIKVVLESDHVFGTPPAERLATAIANDPSVLTDLKDRLEHEKPEDWQ